MKLLVLHKGGASVVGARRDNDYIVSRTAGLPATLDEILADPARRARARRLSKAERRSVAGVTEIERIGTPSKGVVAG